MAAQPREPPTRFTLHLIRNVNIHPERFLPEQLGGNYGKTFRDPASNEVLMNKAVKSASL